MVAVPRDLSLDMHCTAFAFLSELCTVDNEMAARDATRTTTTKSSTRVKPRGPVWRKDPIEDFEMAIISTFSADQQGSKAHDDKNSTGGFRDCFDFEIIGDEGGGEIGVFRCGEGCGIVLGEAGASGERGACHEDFEACGVISSRRGVRHGEVVMPHASVPKHL